MDLRDLLFVLDDLVDSLLKSLGEESGRLRRAEGSAGLLLVFGLTFFMCFLLAGGPYVLVYRPGLLSRADNAFGATFVSSDQLGQNATEGLIIGVMYLLGIVGIYWLYSSSRGGRPSSIVSILAVGLITAAIVMLYLIGSWKM